MTVNDIMFDLLIDNPYYGYLAGKVRFVEDREIDRMKMTFQKVPTALYNPEWFDSLENKAKKGAIIHELLHLALLHPFRREDRQAELWHVACDIANSEFMSKDYIHEDIVTREIIFIETSVCLEAKKTAEYYYQRLMDEDDRIDLRYKTGSPTVTFESGKAYHFDMADDMPKTEINAQAMIDELTSVQSSSLIEGVINEDLAEHTEGIYSDYKVNWRNVLKRFLSGQGKIIVRKSYKRQSRRFDDLPGTKRSVGVKAMVAVDESASVSNEDVNAFHRELLRINAITGTDITAVRFDTSCSDPVALKQFVNENKRERRGGTDFRPVFELADLLKIPLVILFTDGDGEAPDTVDQKVLWVLTNNGKAPKDYGTVVRFDEE